MIAEPGLRRRVRRQLREGRPEEPRARQRPAQRALRPEEGQEEAEAGNGGQGQQLLEERNQGGAKVQNLGSWTNFQDCGI